MLDNCHDYAKDYSISFNTSKFKCSIILLTNRQFCTNPWKVGLFKSAMNPIEFVDHSVHLGLVK